MIIHFRQASDNRYWADAENEITHDMLEKYPGAILPNRVDGWIDIPAEHVHNGIIHFAGPLAVKFKDQAYGWEKEAMEKTKKILEKQEGIVFLADPIHPAIKEKMQAEIGKGIAAKSAENPIKPGLAVGMGGLDIKHPTIHINTQTSDGKRLVLEALGFIKSKGATYTHPFLYGQKIEFDPETDRIELIISKIFKEGYAHAGAKVIEMFPKGGDRA